MENPYAPLKAALPEAVLSPAARRERAIVAVIFAVCMLMSVPGLVWYTNYLLSIASSESVSADLASKIEWTAGVLASLSFLLAGGALLMRSKYAIPLFLPMPAFLVYGLFTSFSRREVFWLCLLLSFLGYMIVLARRGRLH